MLGSTVDACSASVLEWVMLTHFDTKLHELHVVDTTDDGQPFGTCFHRSGGANIVSGVFNGQSCFGQPDLTNFGQSIFCQSIFGSGVRHGPKGWGPNPEKSGPQGWEVQKVGGNPKFRVFSVSRHQFRFFVSHCVSSRGFFGGVWKRLQMCTFGLSGCRVKPRQFWAVRWRVRRKGSAGRGPLKGDPAQRWSKPRTTPPARTSTTTTTNNKLQQIHSNTSNKTHQHPKKNATGKNGNRTISRRLSDITNKCIQDKKTQTQTGQTKRHAGQDKK